MYNYGRNIASKLRASLLHRRQGANDIQTGAESAKGQEREGRSGLIKAQFWFYHGFKEVVATQNGLADRYKTTNVPWDRTK